MGRDTIQLEDAVSTIFGEYLLEFTSEYGSPEVLHPELPGLEETIVDFPEGKFGVYTKFFKFENYRIPLYLFRVGRSDVKHTPNPYPKTIELLLCLVGLSRSYFLGDDVYPIFLDDDDQEMDLFNLISASNPTKVKTGTQPRAAHEVPLLTATATSIIDMKDVTEASKSWGIPSPVKKSPLDFADEDPLLVILEGVGTGGQARDEVPHEIPPVGNPPTTEVAPDLEPEAAAMGSLVRKRRRERGLAAGSTFVTPTDAKSVSDPDPLSYAEPRPYPEQEIAQSSEIRIENVSTAEMSNADFLGRYNINLAQQVAMGSQLRLRFEQENLEALMEAEVDIKRVAEAKNMEPTEELESLRIHFSDLQVNNNQLSQQVSNLQAQVTGEEKIKAAFKDFKKYEDDKVKQRCTDMDARLDALSIDFDEELYPHMLTAIAGRRWVIRHGIHLAVMKCAESTELRKVFANVVSAGIAEGMSEGLKHGADAKYVAALHVLKDLKYPLVDQLEKLKNAPIDLIMASLHLESDAGEDTPQWVRDLCPNSSQLKIPVYPEVSDPRDPLAFKEEILLEDAIAANISRAEKKKKCRVVCHTYGVGSAHHAKFDGVPVSVPTVAPQGLVILLVDAATQIETFEDEASPRLIRSKSLPSMYNLNGP
ncbi:hypothetical protein Tco_0657128 [Tanacetum coccineum]|uniref:Transposase (Putative), gypsy type n=1 Tax=Tanacetum coccineum TaxID=301880 RepID=A0ABQ4XAP6_9ASTR